MVLTREYIKWNAPPLTPKPKLVYGNVNDEEILQNLPDDIDCCYLDGQRGRAKVSKEYPHLFLYVAKLKAFSWTFCCTRGCSDIHETCDEFSEKMKESYQSINETDFALIPYDSSYDRAPCLGICCQVPQFFLSGKVITFFGPDEREFISDKPLPLTDTTLKNAVREYLSGGKKKKTLFKNTATLANGTCPK
jgi:hypothetical protein